MKEYFGIKQYDTEKENKKDKKEVKYDGERWHKPQYEPLTLVQVKAQRIFEILQ